MTYRRRNDRPAARRRDPSSDWLWGWHAVTAALQNPAREADARLVATPDRARSLGANLPATVSLQVVQSAAIGEMLPAGAVHQGVALDTPAIEPSALDDLAQPAQGVLIMLDQVTDPQNVGAVFRTAAALGARGVILQERHAPRLTGVLAKAAAGAIDRIAHARETNLSRSLELLERAGWRAVGLDGEAPDALAEVLDGGATVLVMGSEGEGLRRLVREHCDALARIPMSAGAESLNVAAAAAIALYEARRAMVGQ